jgi:transcription termination/antitermination protein NusG
MIYIVRVTTGQEKIAAEMLSKRAESADSQIYSIVYVESIKGYIFVEGKDISEVTKLVQKTKNTKGFIETPVKIEEIAGILKTSVQAGTKIDLGDTVEMTAGPFKGEKARVIKADEARDELTVEFIEVAVPIPVTIKSKTAKLVQKAGD